MSKPQGKLPVACDSLVETRHITIQQAFGKTQGIQSRLAEFPYKFPSDAGTPFIFCRN